MVTVSGATTVATDLSKGSNLFVRFGGASAKCEQTRKRLLWLFELSLKSKRIFLIVCIVCLITAHFASSVAFSGCGATENFTTSTRYCECSLPPNRHFPRLLSSFYEFSFSVFLHPRSITFGAAHASSPKNSNCSHMLLSQHQPACSRASLPGLSACNPLFFLSPRRCPLFVPSASIHHENYKDSSLVLVNSQAAPVPIYSCVSTKCAFVPASSHRNRDVLPPLRFWNNSLGFSLGSGTSPLFHCSPGVYVPHAAIPLYIIAPRHAAPGTTRDSLSSFAKTHPHTSAPSSSFCCSDKVSSHLSWLPCSSFTVCQLSFAASRSPWPGLKGLLGNITSYASGFSQKRIILKSTISAVHSYGSRKAGAQAMEENHQDTEEEEELFSSSHSLGEKDVGSAALQEAGPSPREQRYHSFVGPTEDEGESQSHPLVAPNQQKSSRFGSLTEPGEPPTPPPKSPFWPSYPPKKISPLPGATLPRWHPRSPFPPLQPRGPFYPQSKEQGAKEQPPTAEKPPDLPKNYRHWVRDSRYQYPQFTTLTASLKYRRRLKRSSRKLDWRLKNVHFRRMYFAWRRNMRDQELHRWMREKVRWTKSAAKYWEREYSRQQKEWLKPRRDEEEYVLAQEPEEILADAQTELAKERMRLQSGRGQRGESSANGSVVSEQAERDSSGEAYNQCEGKERTEKGKKIDRGVKASSHRESAKPPTRRSMDRDLRSTFDGEVSTTAHQSDGSPHSQAEQKIVREREERGEEKEEDDKDLKATRRIEAQNPHGNERGISMRDLTSRVMSSLSPEEILDIAVNGYRLPPMTAAIASSPIPWWASRKGEHKWRGKSVASNVQSKWVNWANPRRRIEAAVGSCLLPREGGILEKLRIEGEKLCQVLKRAQQGGEAAAAHSHSKCRENRESLEEKQSLERWSDDGHSLKEDLRELWRQRKNQREKEGGRRERRNKAGDREGDRAQPDAKLDDDVCTDNEERRSKSDTEEKYVGRESEGIEAEGTLKTKNCEETTVGKLKEKERKISPSSPCAQLEGSCEQSGHTEEKWRRSSSPRTVIDAGKREDTNFSGKDAIKPKFVEKSQTAHPSEKGLGTTKEFLLSCTAGERSGVEPAAQLRVPGISVLEVEEKQRKAIEAAIEVSLMLGHSTIVKTQGSVVPYDVHSPFMRSRTSSRRRRLRLRGRKRGPEKKNMTRQERRLANRNARLKEAEKRRDDIKAARRRAWEESQRARDNAESPASVE